MAKKKKTAKKAAKKKTATRRPAGRKTASARSKSRRTASAKTPAGGLKLSALRAQIDRALRKIDVAAAKEPARYDEARVRLARWAADIDDMCDPQNPFGCGPIMVFPT